MEKKLVAVADLGEGGLLGFKTLSFQICKDFCNNKEVLKSFTNSSFITLCKQRDYWTNKN